MSEKEKVVIEVYEIQDYGYDEYLEEFLHNLNEAYNKIPEEFKEEASIKFESENDTSEIKFVVYYERDETDEELNKRLNSKALYEKQKYHEELATYNRLKAKFEQ